MAVSFTDQAMHCGGAIQSQYPRTKPPYRVVYSPAFPQIGQSSRLETPITRFSP
jgi:hypothetical protein